LPSGVYALNRYRALPSGLQRRFVTFDPALQQEKGHFMKRLLSVSLGILITLCLFVGSERRAFAYVDPGTGLVALQTIASVAAAYAYVIRRRIRAFFTRKEKPPILPAVKTSSGEAV
jgi:hypothetical protein